jgi:hypothetical protein
MQLALREVRELHRYFRKELGVFTAWCEYPDCENRADVFGRFDDMAFDEKHGIGKRLAMHAACHDDLLFVCDGHADVLDNGGVALGIPELNEMEEL